MLTSEFDYNLPEQLIAQEPSEPRDSSRLMIVDKDVHKIENKNFFDIIDYLGKGDLLVWNNSKVFNARLKARLEGDESAGLEFEGKKIFNSHGEVEIFLVRPAENKGVWKCLAKPGKKLHLGTQVRIADDFVGEVMLKEKDGTILIDFKEDDMLVRAKANKYGYVPVPPYIKSLRLKNESGDVKNRYQTVYAKSEGSVAAPTAGFHFTPELIAKLKSKGVEFAEVTLHVGLGTFLPVKTDKIEDHVMHSEWVELTAKNADLINTAKSEGRRVVAVGTTTVRTLEALALQNAFENKNKDLKSSHYKLLNAFSGDVNIFISPGFEFKVVDALITNFHLPKSTLLMLVSAFAGDRKFILKCYKEAIEKKYRFYSFGDAMLIK